MAQTHASQCREIFVKAVCAKGRLLSEHVHTVRAQEDVVDVLGCRVTGLRFQNRLRDDHVRITGEYELQVWVAFDDDSELIRQRVEFADDVPLHDVGEGVLDVEPEVLVDVVDGPTADECAVNKQGDIEVVVHIVFHVDVVGETRLFVQTCPPSDVAMQVTTRTGAAAEWDWVDDSQTS